jgi:hypothetical protein
MLRHTLLLIATLCSAHLAALEQPQPSQEPNPIGINPPARPVVSEGWNLWAQGEALFWKAAVDRLNYVIVEKNSSAPNPPFHASIKSAEFDWNWGYRLSAGYTMPHDRWDLAATWTSINNNGSQSERAKGSKTLLQPTGYQNTLPSDISSVQGKWEIDLSQVELALGKEFFPSPWIKLRPMGGMRSAWIDQTTDAHSKNFSNSEIAEQHGKWHFWGLGFVAGAQVDWMLSHDWSLFSFADYSILWGYFSHEQRQTHAPSQLYQLKKSMRCARGVYDIGFGLKWSHLFSDNRWKLSCKAGYEYHLYPEQNQFLYNTNIVSPGQSDDGSFINNGGDLTYKGLSISIQIDF